MLIKKADLNDAYKIKYFYDLVIDSLKDKKYKPAWEERVKVCIAKA